MLQHFVLTMMLAPAAAAAPCPPVTHVPSADAVHTPDADLDPWLDPATAELVTPAPPRIERRVGDNDVKVDVAVPRSLTEPRADCR
jgi:hypothetical protein